MNLEQINQALNSQIEKMEIQVNNDNTKEYTADEVLAMLYSIRDYE